jgi:quercetin dioxygenase-like cupin family protein
MRRFAGTALFLTLLAGNAFAEGPMPVPAIAVKPLASLDKTASGQPITFPQGPGRVIVAEYIIAPGATLPLHKHPYPRFAYVLQGTLEVTDKDTDQTFLYKPGDVVVEVIGQRHLGRNMGDDAVRLLVLDTTPADVKGNVEIEK